MTPYEYLAIICFLVASATIAKNIVSTGSESVVELSQICLTYHYCADFSDYFALEAQSWSVGNLQKVQLIYNSSDAPKPFLPRVQGLSVTDRSLLLEAYPAREWFHRQLRILYKLKTETLSQHGTEDLL